MGGTLSREEYQRQRGCVAKAVYVTRGEARQFVRNSGSRFDRAVKPYRCEWCGLWHLATQRGADYRRKGLIARRRDR